MSTETLTEWLLARIAEDEKVALRARDADDIDGEPPTFYKGMGRHRDDWGVNTFNVPIARVLAECEAKRRIVELHPIYRGPRLLSVDSSATDYACERCHATSSIDDESVIEALGPCDTLLALAWVYADHPGFHDEWRNA